MKEKRLIILGIFLIFIAVVFAYYLIMQERARHMVLQEADSSAVDLEATDLQRQSQGEEVVILYFYNPGTFPSDPEYLVPEERVIYQVADRVLMAKQVILELFRGPRNREVPSLPEPESEIGLESPPAGIAPRGGRLRQLFLLDDGTAVVDLAAETTNNIEGVLSELLIINSITRSLVENFEEIDQVRFLVEGREQETLAGHVSISHPFRIE